MVFDEESLRVNVPKDLSVFLRKSVCLGQIEVSWIAEVAPLAPNLKANLPFLCLNEVLASIVRNEFSIAGSLSRTQTALVVHLRSLLTTPGVNQNGTRSGGHEATDENGPAILTNRCFSRSPEPLLNP